MRLRGRSDSLDLLLDAMCNMLGGVIFLSLFSALLLSVPAPEPKGGAAFDARSEAELAQSLAALRERAALLEALQTPETPDDPEQEESLRRACAAAEKEYRALLAEQRRRRSEREERERERRLREAFPARTPAERERELARLRTLEHDLRSALAALPRKPWVFAPPDRAALRPWRLILADGRLYRLGDNAAVRAGGSGEVRAEAVRRAGREYWMLRPEPDKGVFLADFPWDAWRETLPREGSFVELLVLPGDIAGAAAVREELRRRGVPQSWCVRDPENLALVVKREAQ